MPSGARSMNPNPDDDGAPGGLERSLQPGKGSSSDPELTVFLSPHSVAQRASQSPAHFPRVALPRFAQYRPPLGTLLP